jgi:hypothetical protein
MCYTVFIMNYGIIYHGSGKVLQKNIMYILDYSYQGNLNSASKRSVTTPGTTQLNEKKAENATNRYVEIYSYSEYRTFIRS